MSETPIYDAVIREWQAEPLTQQDVQPPFQAVLKQSLRERLRRSLGR